MTVVFNDLHGMQVIGELSNDGQPMRRFVQTFVLAPQAAKKYYVHSDIFRYHNLCDDYVEGLCCACATSLRFYTGCFSSF